MKYLFIGDKYQLKLYRDVDKILQEEKVVIVNNRSDASGHKDIEGILVCPHSRIYDLGRHRGLIRDIERYSGVSHIVLFKEVVVDIHENGLRAVLRRQ